MSHIVIVDYGMGNLRSVAKALEHVVSSGDHVEISSVPSVISSADKIVFPGQGAARDCMRELSHSKLDDVVLEAAREKPFLGICMGMQVLMAHSQENQGTDCLGLFPGEVRFFGNELKDKNGVRLKIPHMGWNTVEQCSSHPLWEGIRQYSRYYFVHSYYVDPRNEDIVAGRSEYGIDFTAAIARDYVFAVQFHPEKSASDGLRLLRNFSRWDGKIR